MPPLHNLSRTVLLPKARKAFTLTTAHALPRLPTARSMSLFAPRLPPTPRGAEPSFSGLFRLLDDFDRYATSGVGPHTQPPSFVPRFDVRETEAAYELQGEIPGVGKEAVTIEFRDAQTLVVSGRVERSSLHHYDEDDNDAVATATEDAEAAAADDDEPGSIITGGDRRADEAARAGDDVEEVKHRPRRGGRQDRYWVSERSVGEFSRAFNFPAPVDADAVKASLRDGVLALTVPKTKKRAGRRITID